MGHPDSLTHLTTVPKLDLRFETSSPPRWPADVCSPPATGCSGAPHLDEGRTGPELFKGWLSASITWELVEMQIRFSRGGPRWALCLRSCQVSLMQPQLENGQVSVESGRTS